MTIIEDIRSAPAWFRGPYGPAPAGYVKSNAPSDAADEIVMLMEVVREKDAEIARLKEAQAGSIEAEREACAKLGDELWPEMHKYWGEGQARAACMDYATAIRARSHGGT